MKRTPSLWVACEAAESLDLGEDFRTYSANGYGRNIRRSPKFLGTGS